MRTLLLLLVTAFLVNEISCELDVLSKFHQHSYKVKDYRVQLISYDKNYFNVFEIKTFKYNRTTTAHKATVNPKIDLDDKLESLSQAYKFLSNQYRRIALRFQVNVKKSFDTNAIGIKAIRKCGNVTNLIFYKGITYHICNFVIDETRFPPLIPNGQYKVELQYLYLNQEIALLHIFLEIYTPIYPKN